MKQAKLLRAYQTNPYAWVHNNLVNDDGTPVVWWETQIEIGKAIVQHPRVLVRASHSVGKCVAASEKLTLADGRRILASDLVGHVFPLLTIDGNDNIVSADAVAEWNAIETVWEITTETGRKIRRNAQHPIWTATGVFKAGVKTTVTPNGWTPLSNIDAGDLVAVTEYLPAFADPIRLPEAEIKTLAYLIGEGGLTQGGITFSQQVNKQLSEFGCCIQEYDCWLEPKPNSYDYRIVASSGSGGNKPGTNKVINLLKTHGLMGKHSRDKFIPDAIWRLPEDQLALFLNRLYATDGWASLSKGHNIDIGFCSASETLCRDLQEILLKLGINSRLSQKPSVNAWVVSIHNTADSIKFCEQVGIYGKEEAVDKVYQQALTRRAGKRSRVWRYKNISKGLRWEKVVKVEAVGTETTVAIEVPGYNTYLTTFWEHNTHMAGGLVNWFFHCFEPSITLTTATTKEQVKDALWKEVRTQNPNNPYVMPADPRMKKADNHFAVGYTAAKGTGFHGRHERYVFIIFDEATGIESEFWDSAEGMMTGLFSRWLCILNPTSKSSRAYHEEKGGKWHVIRMSAIDHPNIAAQMYGKPLVIPGAVDIKWVDDKIRGPDPWCVPVTKGDEINTDLLWPWKGQTYWPDNEYNHPRYYRPGPLMESRVLGYWPTQGATVIWTEAMFDAMVGKDRDPFPMPLDQPIVIGCDVARKGADNTSIVVRRGGIILDHETHNGWDTKQTTSRLKQLCDFWGHWANMDGKRVRVNVDDDGLGGGIYDNRDGYNFQPISSAKRALNPNRYYKRRSELWYATAERGRKGMIDLSYLQKTKPESVKLLREQLLAPEGQLDGQGRQFVEDKDITKKRIKRSPDDADAFNLAFAEGGEPNMRLSGGESIAVSAGHISPPTQLPDTAYSTDVVVYGPDGLPRRRKVEEDLIQDDFLMIL